MESAATKILNMRGVRPADLSVLIMAVGCLFIILSPLPPWMMDGLLMLNITVSVLILLTTIFITQPLQFSVFPSMLLGVTLFRLALNIATTRLIFSNAVAEGSMAAGGVIEAFGNFVAGSNPLIGVIIFTILVVIQFVVITKGATRISEVAARFTLDAMPGKQMAIDADLNAGLIDEASARKRRLDINREADFYGAMDGASKFVRGDAIASIIITLINLVAGFAFGFLNNMNMTEAVGVFTLLTIGDGLVSQVPALIVSTSAGLIVTRSTAEGDLSHDIGKQLLADPKIMYYAAAFISILGLTPLPKMPLIILAAGLVASGRVLDASKVAEVKRKDEAKVDSAAKEKAKPADVTGLLHVDPMELEVGYGIIRLVDQKQGGDLLERIQMIRRQTAVDLGLVLPPIRIRDNMQLPPNEYVVKIKGSRVTGGTVQPESFLAMDSGIATGPLDGQQTTEPAFGLPAYWISTQQKQRAEAMGYTVVDPASVLATHITEIVKQHSSELLTRDEVHNLLDNLKKTSAKLVAEVVPDVLKVAEIQRILQMLLTERVSIRNLATIVEALGEYGPRTKDPQILTEYVRNALAREICQAHVDRDGKLYVVTLDPKMEDVIQSSVSGGEGAGFLSMAPQTLEKILKSMTAELEKLLTKGHQPILLVSPQIRPHVKRIADRIQSGISVLSYNEVVRDVQVEALGMAGMPEQQG